MARTLAVVGANAFELAARVDKTNDGYISREEFEDAFGPDDDWILDGGDFQPQLALPPAVMQSRPSSAPTPAIIIVKTSKLDGSPRRRQQRAGNDHE